MTATARRRQRTRAALLAGVVAAGLGAATAARAEDVSAEAAQDLEQQVHDWLASLLGPQVELGERPLHVTPEADHYRLELPLTGLLADSGLTIEGDPVSARLTPLEGGRWALDDMRVPSPLHMSFPLPATDPAATGTGAGGTARFSATIDQQEQHAVLDPSLATPSHWDATFKGYTSSTEGLKQAGSSTMHLDATTLHMALEPVQDGRLNFVEDTDTHLLATNSTLPDGSLASFSVGRMRGTVRLDGLVPDRVGSLVRAATALAPLGAAAAAAAQGGAAGDTDANALHALAEQNRAAAEADRRAADADKQAVAEGRMTPAERTKNAEERRRHARDRLKALQAARAQGGKPPLTAEQRKAVHDALVAVADLMGGFDERFSMDDVHFVAAGHTGHLAKLDSGLSFAAPDGRAAIHFNLVLDGLDSPEIPPGVYRDYLPRHIALAPRVGGVPVSDLRALLLRAADSDGDDPQLQAQALGLLAKGPVAVGLDALSLDFGPATLKGSGEVRISGTDTYEGEAHLAATGLDALVQQANSVPELKQAAPVLFLLKGMGKQNGAETVWDITYRDKKMLVNGNDLSGMLPGK
jgi:hypothetical protein